MNDQNQIKDPGYDSRLINIRKHHVRVSTMGSEGVKELIKRLLAISQRVGVTVPPTADQELPELVAYIITHFGFMPLDEISYAFELSTALKLPTQAAHFNAFNQRYVGAVLGSHQDYFKAEYRKYAEIERKKKEEEDNREVKPQDQDIESAYDLLKGFVIKNGTFPIAWNWQGAFMFAEKREYIKMTRDQKMEALETNMKKIRKQNKLAALDKQKDRTITVLDEAGINLAAVLLCRKEALRNHFEIILNKPIPDWTARKD